MPCLTHSWIAAEEIVAPSVATITRSTSKKGRSKIISPFLLTTRRSLFFDTETPKPSTNTSPKTLSAGYTSLPVERIMPDVPDTIGPAQGAGANWDAGSKWASARRSYEGFCRDTRVSAEALSPLAEFLERSGVAARSHTRGVHHGQEHLLFAVVVFGVSLAVEGVFLFVHAEGADLGGWLLAKRAGPYRVLIAAQDVQGFASDPAFALAHHAQLQLGRGAEVVGV